jgi:hypothetical protein
MEFAEAVDALKKAIQDDCKGSDVPALLPDEVLFMFAQCRGFDMQSAAQRYIRFMKIYEEYSLSFEETPEVTKGLSQEIFHSGRFDLSGRPVLIGTVRNLDWRRITPREMQKTWFFCVWKALCSTALAQSQGIVIVVIAKGISPSLFHREFHGFVAKAVQECMPMKVHRLFILNQPCFFSSIIWPLLSQLFSAKIRQRIVMVGKNYELLQDHVPIESIPPAWLGQDMPDDAPEVGASAQ